MSSSGSPHRDLRPDAHLRITGPTGAADITLRRAPVRNAPPVERFFHAFRAHQTPYLRVTPDGRDGPPDLRDAPRLDPRASLTRSMPTRRHTAGHSLPRRNGRGSSRA